MEEISHKKGRIYYSMGEVAEMFDVNQSLIRFWESKFDILKPHKNKKGNRMFTPKDVDNLRLIYHLVKEKGMTLAGAQKVMKQDKEGIVRDMEIRERLMSIRSMLVEIREELKLGGSDFSDDDYEYVPAEMSPAIGTIVTDEEEILAAPTTEAVEEEHLYADEIGSYGFIEDEVQELPEEDFGTPVEGFAEEQSFDIAEETAVPDDTIGYDAEEADDEAYIADDEVYAEPVAIAEETAEEPAAPEQPLVAHTEQPLFEVEPIEPKTEDELAMEAEVLETLAELEKDEKPKPQIIEQTLF